MRREWGRPSGFWHLQTSGLTERVEAAILEQVFFGSRLVSATLVELLWASCRSNA